jgi:magnesium and cobalt exporter, CNNM family
MAYSLEIFLIISLILVNGLFAMAEFALLKANRSRLGEGPAAEAVGDLLEEPNRFLSTVQVAITAVGTLAGAVGGATLADEFGTWLNELNWIQPHGQTLGVLTVWLAITYLSLVFGELVPKRLALRSPESWALRLGRFMRALSKLFSPLIKVLSVSTNLVLRMLGHKPQSREEVVTEAEVREMIARAVEQGELKPLEHELTESVFLLDDRLVKQMMTPRNEVHALSKDDDKESVLATLQDGLHSRYLLLGDTPHELLGVVLTRDILKTLLSEQILNLRELSREIPSIPQDMDMLGALESFKEGATSIVAVNDEHGRLAGLLTAQDLLESFAGRIHRPGQSGLS